MRSILYITNLENGYPAEDRLLIDALRADYEIITTNPRDSIRHIEHIEAVIIRNVWPTYEYQAEWNTIKQQLRTCKKPIYNPLSGSGDQCGKEYLMHLYRRGFPVIPTVDSLENIYELPDSESYFIKPKESSGGAGSKTVRKSRLSSLELSREVLQPFIRFESEPSFFYLDNRFLYAISMPNRMSNRTMIQFTPSKGDREFAELFVEWNNLSYGLQRIDGIRTQDGKLLLNEIEDESPALYLLNLEESERARVVSEIRNSLNAAFSNSLNRNVFTR